jgi:hypothetical protein
MGVGVAVAEGGLVTVGMAEEGGKVGVVPHIKFDNANTAMIRRLDARQAVEARLERLEVCTAFGVAISTILTE